ncbi:MAG: SRPBCC domain-containing protein [Gammaproteobacteria bacterium]|nr:SRPBCC domain-containing protein [Gammaproteobacteria bacterium]NNL49686.1 polyketide cyclase [Woeseiaceae bacterium]
MKTDSLSAKAKTRIKRPPSEVFAAFADADLMSKFWFTRRDKGLKEGETVKWYVGSDDGAFAFDVLVKELRKPERIVIEWMGQDGNPARVVWTFEESEQGDTILTVEESGYAGSNDAIVERALDSTGGFNQVVVAAKALVEHGVEVNVVADHVP